MGEAIYTKAERDLMKRNGHAKQKHAAPPQPTTATKLEPHSLAFIFPTIKGKAFDALVADIKANGQREPVVLLDGLVLDGRNRVRACEVASVAVRTREFGSLPSDGTDPRAFVISENVNRRHLNQNQRAVLASDLADMPHGRPGENAPFGAISQDEAADLVGTSRRNVQRARSAMNPETLVDSENENSTPSRAAPKPGLEAELEAWREFVKDGEAKISKAATYAERPDLPELIKQADLISRAHGEPSETRRLFHEAVLKMLEGEEVEPEKAEQTSGRGKPQWLMRALVRHYSYLGDTICDPLAGYGSTLRAARDQGRKAIGSEIEPTIATAADDPDLRVGPWQSALADVDRVHAVICDPPYSERTHSAGTTRNDESSAAGLTPTYECWTPADVDEFVAAWAPRIERWLVALTDSELWPAWRRACERNGLHTFQPIPCVIRGMSVRVGGDGPSSWAIWAVVARTKAASNMGTRPGAYVGTKSRELWDPDDETEEVESATQEDCGE